MLVVAYFVLFAFVMLFAWAIETCYGQPRSVVRAMQVERRRLAITCAIHSQSLQTKSPRQEAQCKLRSAQPSNSSKHALLASRSDSLSDHNQERAARMESLSRYYNKLSLVHDSLRTPDSGLSPAFSPKSNPAKLALVPRDRTITT